MILNLVKKTEFTLHKLLLLLLFIQLPVWVNAQTKEQSKSEREAEKLQEKYEKGIEKWEKNSANSKNKTNRAGNLSLKNFTRGGLHTGNLIQVPYITNVNISAGYWSSFVSPSRIIWPKGSGVEYGHTMSYMVGAEVQDDDGQNHIIVSESYNRSGGDTDPDGSHKYHFTPVPGYYNMYGDQSSTNKLNDNSTDRQQLESAGYYFVGGLSEDLNGNGELDAGEDLNNNNELDLVLENKVEFNAQSNVVETWPEFWPAQSYPGDDRQVGETRPGVRSGRWNGAYGSFIRADQESYYISDDRDNDEFPYYPFINPETGEPDTRDWEDGGRRGIGIEIEARQYQWTSVLAEDIFVTTFDVKNISRNQINKSIIAMLVDYDIGGSTGSNNALFDTKDDITYQWHKNNLVQNGFKVGYAGVGFLESPGIANDGIDNDADGMVDESRNDGIDNDGDWRIWVDVDGNGQYDNEDVNNNFILDPNEDTNGNGVLDIEPINDDKGSDGVGPEDENYPGPDPDGSEANGIPDRGEPNFEFTDNDEIDQIGLTNMVIRTPSDFDRDIDDDELFWQDYIQPSPETDFIIPTETNDIIYSYSSGTVAINKNQSQRFSIAFFCGNDFDDMLRNKRTMQNIYNADYDFAKPPRRPFLTAVPDDNKVILVWDESAEISRDPIYGFDFEMYKIYRSTDPEFNDIKTITDAFGNPLLWEAVAQFDKKNGLTGAHPIPIGSFGISYDMGTDSGLEYRYIDEDVDNGRTYYYAVASVDQGYAPNFYADGISEYSSLASISPSESSKIIEVDAFERPVNIDRNTAVVVPQARATGYVPPSIENDEIVKVSGKSTGRIQVDFLIPDSANSKGYEYEVSFTDDESYKNLDSLYLDFGKTTGFTFKNTTTGEVLAVSDPNAQGSAIFESPILNARLYDGMKISIENPLVPELKSAEWLANSARIRKPTISGNVTSSGSSNTAVPRDYEIRVSELNADTSSSISVSARIATNYTIWDVTYPNAAKQLPFSLKEAATPIFPQDTVKGMLSPGDEIDIKVGGINTPFGLVYANSTWRYNFSVSENNSEILNAINSQVNELYDSLATYQVRDIGSRKYGADLKGRQIIDFLNEINTWYAGVEDSLKNTPGVNAAIAAYYTPKEYKEELDELFSKEMPISGDKFLMQTTKPFNSDDVYRFKVTGNIVEEQIQKSSLDSIYVAPDPYIVVNPLEPRNTSLPGRGERRIDFRNLPQTCTIQVFTMSGKLVKTIEHNSSEYQSLESWDLKSDDGLDVAFGVYIYHVKAPGIGEKIGRFALIK